MPKPLLSAESLIRSSWDQYLANSKLNGRIVLNYLATLAIISLVLLLIPATVFSETLLGRILLSSIISLPLLCVEIISIKALLAGSLKMSMSDIMRIIAGGLWVSLLTYLALLGGAILLIIPAIWLSIPLRFALINFLDEQTPGTAALKQSMTLVRYRWWSTLWRLVAGGIVFIILMLVCYLIISLLLFLVLGNTMGVDQGASSYLNYIVLIITTVAFKPLFIIFALNLYKNLKETA